MGNSNVACTLDIMNLMANVDNRKCIEELSKAIKEEVDKILELERRIREKTSGSS